MVVVVGSKDQLAHKIHIQVVDTEESVLNGILNHGHQVHHQVEQLEVHHKLHAIIFLLYLVEYHKGTLMDALLGTLDYEQVIRK